MLEVDRFLDAESRLLRENAVPASPRFVELASPVMRARVLEAGSGAPVVLIHGGNSVAASWAPLLGLLREDARLMAPDRPGCGLTDRVDYRKVPSFRDHCISFLGSLLDALGLDRVSVVGNSIGGWWALVYALAHPERVDRIVCLGEPAASSPRIQLRHRMLATPVVSSLLYATVLRPTRDRTRAQMAGVVAHPERLSEAFLDLAYSASVLPGARLAWTSMIERFVSGMRAPCGTYSIREQLRSIRQRVLLVWGDKDGCPPRWGEELCRHLPNASLEVLRDVGHLPWLDEPERVAALVRAFIRA